MAYLGNLSLPFDPTRTAAAPRDADRFSGNGSTVVFTLSRAVQKAVDIEVFVENVQQEPITAYDVNQTTLTFTGTPPSGTNNIYVVYRNFDSGAQVYVPDGSITYSKLANNIRIFTTDNLTPNGNNAVFTLSEPPADANTVMVTVDGVVQRAPVHYTTSGSTITFTSNPPAGSNVHVRHLGFRTTSTVTQLAANSFISQPNIASPTITGYTSIANTAFFDASNNRVGFNTTTPNAAIDITVTDGTFRQNTTSFLRINNPSSSHQSSIDYVGNNIMRGRVRSDYVGNMNYVANTTSLSSTSGHFFLNAGDSGVGNAHFAIISNGTFQAAIPNFISTTQAQPAFFVRAWCNHTATGSPGTTLNGSGNISSVTRSATGNFTYTFTTAMPDANYTVQVNSWQSTSTVGVSYNIYNLTTSNFFVTTNENNVSANPSVLYITVTR